MPVLEQVTQRAWWGGVCKQTERERDGGRKMEGRGLTGYRGAGKGRKKERGEEILQEAL